jgi:hypothetical protein
MTSISIVLKFSDKCYILSKPVNDLARAAEHIPQNVTHFLKHCAILNYPIENVSQRSTSMTGDNM